MNYSTPWLAALAALLSASSGCQPTALSAEALTAYVADPAHQLRQLHQVGNTEVSVTYQPVDLLVARELGGLPPQRAAVDSLRSKYQHAAYFILAISRNHRELLQPSEGFADYSSLLQNLSFRMGEQVRLCTSQGDTLKPSVCYLDRTYASAEATQLLVAFPKLPATGTWQFRVQECGLGLGNMHFDFRASAPTTAPALALAD